MIFAFIKAGVYNVYNVQAYSFYYLKWYRLVDFLPICNAMLKL